MLAESDPRQHRVIDALQPVDVVAAHVRAAVSGLLGATLEPAVEPADVEVST
jgi:hypothetical protein